LSIVTALNFLTNATPVVESVFDDRFAKDSMDCTSQHSYAYGIDAIPETFLTCSIGNKRNIGDKGSYLYGFWWYLLCYQSTVAVTRKAKYTLS
jgi:hypothetical protein